MSLDECNKNNCKVDQKVNDKLNKIIESIQLNKEKYSKLKPKDNALTDKYKKEVWDLFAGVCENLSVNRKTWFTGELAVK